MFNRNDVLAFINEVIVSNHGDMTSESTIVRDSGIDSFGFAVLFLELDDKYGCFSADFTDSMYNTANSDVTIGMLIDRVEQCS